MMDVVGSASRRVVIMMVLVAFLAFALGYLWGASSSVAPIVIEKCSDVSR